jgi:hypothetical protein
MAARNRAVANNIPDAGESSRAYTLLLIGKVLASGLLDALTKVQTATRSSADHPTASAIKRSDVRFSGRKDSGSDESAYQFQSGWGRTMG